MKDITLNAKDKSTFITGYETNDTTITINYADGANIVLQNEDNPSSVIEKRMIEQALDPKFIEEIKKKLKINFYSLYFTSLFTSALAGNIALSIATKQNVTKTSFVVLAGSALVDYALYRKRKKLLELKEDAEKYKLIAENIDLLNESYCEEKDAKPKTMNDADEFSYEKVKKIINTATKRN